MAQVAFSGRRGPLFSLLLRNAALTLVTLGIYRFWAKVRLRRYFWHNISVLGDPLEYSGTAVELLIGFLIVVAVLVPLSMAYGTLGAMAAALGPRVGMALEAGYYLVLFALIQVGFYRMWRYRLTRTTWRGIRFGQVGSALWYMWRALGWMALTILTLGVAYPWMRVDLTAYRLNNTQFGASRFNFQGAGRDLLAPWLWALLVWLVPLAVFVFLNLQLVTDLTQYMDGEEMTDLSTPDAAVVLLPWLAVPILFLRFKVFEFRYVAARTRLADTGFHSDIRTSAVVVAAMVTGFAFVILLGSIPVLFLVVGTGAAMLTQSVIFVTIPLVLFVIFMMSILGYLIFRYELVAAVCRTLTITDPQDLENTVRRTGEDPSFGEGLADAFDIGAI